MGTNMGCHWLKDSVWNMSDYEQGENNVFKDHANLALAKVNPQ